MTSWLSVTHVQCSVAQIVLCRSIVLIVLPPFRCLVFTARLRSAPAFFRAWDLFLRIFSPSSRKQLLLFDAKCLVITIWLGVHIKVWDASGKHHWLFTILLCLYLGFCKTISYIKMCIFWGHCIIQLREEMHLPGWSYAVGIHSHCNDRDCVLLQFCKPSDLCYTV